jgi:hypothetical protein
METNQNRDCRIGTRNLPLIAGDEDLETIHLSNAGSLEERNRTAELGHDPFRNNSGATS